ncbi:hypothetical protein EVAR_85373_1 [Eumeta japonica]|uniref:Uncharacterized protein n=1 Tax=Eumeta variegata TaxID=151549 RepID=A0A4C1WT99_EUMVA|nr:hypothetical protein EVAR_85373_1 [Eumeta japonica]
MRERTYRVRYFREAKNKSKYVSPAALQPSHHHRIFRDRPWPNIATARRSRGRAARAYEPRNAASSATTFNKPFDWNWTVESMTSQNL